MDSGHDCSCVAGMQSDDGEETIKKYGPPAGRSRVVSVFTKACEQLPEDHRLWREGEELGQADGQEEGEGLGQKDRLQKDAAKLRSIVASLVRDGGPGYTLDFLEGPSYMQNRKYIEVARAPLQYTWDEYVSSLFKDHPGDMLCIAFIAKVLERSVILTSPVVGNKRVVVKPFISNNNAILLSLDWSEAQADLTVLTSNVEVPPVVYIPSQKISLEDADSFRGELKEQYEINKLWNELYSQIYNRNVLGRNAMQKKAEGKIDEDEKQQVTFNNCKEEIERIQGHHVGKEIKLKDHQIQGVKFALSHLSRTGAEGDKLISRGCLLAHSMGAGKTIQTFFVMKFLQETYGSFMVNFVIVCPLAVLGEWHNNILLFHGNASEVTPIKQYGFIFRDKNVTKPQIALLTLKALIDQYNIDSSDVCQMFSKDPPSKKCLLIFDEAHKIKNPQSNISKTIQEIYKKSKANFLFLTGTPLQNCLSELFNICDNLTLQDSEQNKRIMINVKDKSGELLKRVNDATTGTNSAFLKKTYHKVVDAVQESLVFWVDRVSPAVVEGKLNVKKRQFNVFFKLKNESILAETFGEAKNNKYSYTSVQSWNDENTAKPDFLKKLIRDMDSLKHQKVIFMFFHTDVGKRAEEIIESTARGGKSAVKFVNGATNAMDRKKTFEEFNNTEHDLRYLVIQEEVGGVGVNLQYGGNVIVFLQGVNFNPSITQQAIARIYRMGQTRNCYILSLMTYTSLEMAKLEINKTKKKLSNAILDSNLATEDMEETEDDAETTKTDLENLDDFRKHYKVDFDQNTLSGRIENEWQSFQPRSTLLSSTEEPLDSITAILAEVQTEGFDNCVKIAEDFEHSTRLQPDDVSVKKEPALERFTATKNSENEKESKTKYILNFSRPERVVKLITGIQEMLFNRVYYCNSTGLYVSNDALDLDPPLFWPGTPMPRMDVLVPKYATSQNLQAFLSDTELSQAKDFKYPKIKFLTKAGDGLTPNPTRQQLIDNVQFCLHYPIRSNAKTDKHMVVKDLRVYFQLMLKIKKEYVHVFAIPTKFYQKFQDTTSKSKKYIKVSGKQIDQVKLESVMKVHQISTTTTATAEQKLQTTMVLLNNAKQKIKTLNSTDPVFEVKVPDGSDITSETLKTLYQKDFLAVFACTTEQEEPEHKTALFVKDHLAWWSSENGTLTRFDWPQGRLKSVFVHIPQPEQVQIDTPHKVAWKYNEEQVLVAAEYDPEETNYKVCLSNTQKLPKDLKTKMLPDATYFRDTIANATLVQKFPLDYFTFFFENQLGLKLLGSSKLQFDVEKSTDETENKRRRKKTRKSNKLTVLYEESKIKLAAKYTCTASQGAGETTQGGEFEFDLMDPVSTVTNKVEAIAGLTNLTLKKIDGRPVEVRANSPIVSFLKASSRLDSATAIFTFEQKVAPVPKKQTIEYWREVQADDNSIEFKEETSDDLRKEDVETIRLKINKDKKHQQKKLVFLSPLSEETIKSWISWQYQTRLNIDAGCMSVVLVRKENGGEFECKQVKINMSVTGMAHPVEINDVNLFDPLIKVVEKRLGKGFTIRSVYGERLSPQTTTTEKDTILEILEDNKPSTRAEFVSLGVEDKTKQHKTGKSNTSQQRPQLPERNVASDYMQQSPWVVDIDESPQLSRTDPGAPKAGQASRPHQAATNPAKTSRPHSGATNSGQASKPDFIFLDSSSDSETERPAPVIDLDISPENSPRAPAKNQQQAQGSTQKTPGGGPGAGKEVVPQDGQQGQGTTHKKTVAKLSSDESDSDEDSFFLPRKTKR